MLHQMSTQKQKQARERLNDLQETADRIRCSPWTVRRLIDQGHIRAIRIGRRLLVSESEIARVMREGASNQARAGATSC